MPDRPMHVRQTDAPGHESEFRAQRQVDPNLWDWEAAYGKAALRGRGLLLGLLVFGALILVSNFYIGFRIEAVVAAAVKSSGREHDSLVRSAEQTTCILALTPEERLKFREDVRTDAWSRWCWWLRRPEAGP